MICEDLMYFACLFFGFRLFYNEIAMNIDCEPPGKVVAKLKQTGR